jgi:hypothetical protein
MSPFHWAILPVRIGIDGEMNDLVEMSSYIKSV